MERNLFYLSRQGRNAGNLYPFVYLRDTLGPVRASQVYAVVNPVFLGWFQDFHENHISLFEGLEMFFGDVRVGKGSVVDENAFVSLICEEVSIGTKASLLKGVGFPAARARNTVVDRLASNSGQGHRQEIEQFL